MATFRDLLAMNAASLAAVGDDLPDADRIRREWAELVGVRASTRAEPRSLGLE